jgi:hypothetical protein
VASDAPGTILDHCSAAVREKCGDYVSALPDKGGFVRLRELEFLASLYP